MVDLPLSATRARMTDGTLVILAGGRGVRMGGALKPLLRLPDGRTFLAAIEQTLAPHVARVLVVVPDDLRDRVGSETSSEVVTDPGAGPALALVSAARCVTSAWILAVAADQPYPSQKLLARLALERSDGVEAVAVGSIDVVEPLFALYSTAALLRVMCVGGSGEKGASLGSVLGAMHTKIIARSTLDWEEVRALRDIDTWEDAEEERVSAPSP